MSDILSNPVAAAEKKSTDEDFTERVAAAVTEATAIAATGQYLEAFERVLSLERVTRMATDSRATETLALHILHLCRSSDQWSMLNDQLVILMKRRGQLKSVQIAIVRKGMEYLEQAQDAAVQSALLNVLREVSEGKIHLELEQARLTRIFCKNLEDAGDVTTAAATMQEVSVETIGAMEKTEKLDYILEQMRLLIKKDDFIRFSMISKKLSARVISPESDDVKLRYYDLMLQYYIHEKKFFDVCQCYQSIYTTVNRVKTDTTFRDETLKALVVHLLIAPYDDKQHDLVLRTYADTSLEQLPVFKKMLRMLVEDIVYTWTDFQRDFEPIILAEPVFTGPRVTEESRKLLHDRLRSSFVQRNLRVIAKHYSRIRLERLAEILCLPIADTEQRLYDLASREDFKLYSKTDRVRGIVTFQPTRDPVQVLGDWSGNISQLVEKVGYVSHLIDKELVTYGLA